MQDESIETTSETPMIDEPVVYGPIAYSARVGDLMRALSLAQAEMVNPDHDSTNYYGKGYASMAAVRNAVMPPLTKHGIAVTQFPDFPEGFARCITLLWYGDQYLRHEVSCRVVKTTTEWKDRVKMSITVPVAELTHQDSTGPFSYLRRIALKAIAGIADEEDEEGEKAGGKPTPQRERVVAHESEDEAGSQQRAPRERPSTHPRPTAAEEVSTQVETARQALLSEIWNLYKEAIQPLRHAGMHKALFFHSFHLDKPEHIKEQSLETLEAGIALYRHLTAQLRTWDRSVKPDEWIAVQQRQLATQALSEVVVPEGFDVETGEDHRDMPTGWLTEDEQREQQAQEEAALLEHAGQH